MSLALQRSRLHWAQWCKCQDWDNSPPLSVIWASAFLLCVKVGSNHSSLNDADLFQWMPASSPHNLHPSWCVQHHQYVCTSQWIWSENKNHPLKQDVLMATWQASPTSSTLIWCGFILVSWAYLWALSHNNECHNIIPEHFNQIHWINADIDKRRFDFIVPHFQFFHSSGSWAHKFIALALWWLVIRSELFKDGTLPSLDLGFFSDNCWWQQNNNATTHDTQWSIHSLPTHNPPFIYLLHTVTQMISSENEQSQQLIMTCCSGNKSQGNDCIGSNDLFVWSNQWRIIQIFDMPCLLQSWTTHYRFCVTWSSYHCDMSKSIIDIHLTTALIACEIKTSTFSVLWEQVKIPWFLNCTPYMRQQISYHLRCYSLHFHHPFQLAFHINLNCTSSGCKETTPGSLACALHCNWHSVPTWYAGMPSDKRNGTAVASDFLGAQMDRWWMDRQTKRGWETEVWWSHCKFASFHKKADNETNWNKIHLHCVLQWPAQLVTSTDLPTEKAPWLSVVNNQFGVAVTDCFNGPTTFLPW